MTQASISAKRQISIPKTIRERLNLKPGAQVALDVQGEQVVMRRLVSGFPDWRSMRGMLRGAGNLHDDARVKSFLTRGRSPPPRIETLPH